MLIPVMIGVNKQRDVTELHKIEIKSEKKERRIANCERERESFQEEPFVTLLFLIPEIHQHRISP